MKDKKPSPTREKLIQAANQVSISAGINQLTLEAVAEAAGVSKGGLLYHFPSKEALIQAMIEHYLNLFEARLARYLPANAPVTAANWLQAYARATIEIDEQENAFSSALFAAVSINPELLKPMHERYAVWQARLEETTTDPALATIIRLAMDGLWIADLFGMAPPDAALRHNIYTKLIALTQEVEK